MRNLIFWYLKAWNWRSSFLSGREKSRRRWRTSVDLGDKVVSSGTHTTQQASSKSRKGGNRNKNNKSKKKKHAKSADAILIRDLDDQRMHLITSFQNRSNKPAHLDFADDHYDHAFLGRIWYGYRWVVAFFGKSITKVSLLTERFWLAFFRWMSSLTRMHRPARRGI